MIAPALARPLRLAGALFMRTRLLPITFALAALGCGASEQEIRDAKTSGYQTDFAIVYSEALAATRELYPNLVEDARVGVIKTAWHWVRIAEGGEEQQTQSQSQALGQTSTPTGFQATT